MSIALSQKLKELEKRVAELEARLKALEEKRGPGRPKQNG
jgi:BMFP domain-containing protein YqiC